MPTMALNNPITAPHVGLLGVGPEKTGTTWIHNVLEGHPDVWLPPCKELSFFWQDFAFPDETFFDRLTKNEWHHKRHRDYAKYRFKHAMRYPRSALRDMDRLKWDLHHIVTTHDDQWYRDAFPTGAARLTGEISPQYFFLPTEQIKKIFRLCPNAKIIITLREPSAWIWSFVRMLVKKGEMDVDDGSVDAFLDEKIAENSFARSAKLWLDTFPKDQVKIFFYEDLQRDPWSFYCAICEFLALEPQASARETSERRVNAGRAMDQPERLQRKMADGWREDKEALRALLGRLPEEWSTPV
ncbi:MAG: sulfotransferase [Pseudomonadota bacterium]